MDFKAGHGTTNLWGYSRAVDLVEESCLKDSQSKAKILLVGENDCRNLCKTISKLGFKNNLNLEFTIGETSVTGMSRILLLFKTLFQTEIPKDEKILFFLEIFANGKIRKKTLEFIQNTGKQIEMEIVDNSCGIFDFSRLKFREKDDLISVLKFWRSANEFHFEKLWDQRLLRYFKRRYDARENIIDWDYHAKVLDIDQTRLSILSRKEYLHWRMTGNAFQVSRGGASSSLCDHAFNKTLATVDVLREVRILSQSGTLKGAYSDGVGVVKWGYFSDIIMGPFIAYGIDTEDKELLKTQNDKHMKTCQEIVEHNVSTMIYEFEHQDKMQDDKIAEIKEVENLLKRVKVDFLPCDPAYIFDRKKKDYQDSFDCVFIGNSMAHRIGDAAALLKKDGCMIVETAKYMPDLSKEQRDMFVEKELSMAAEANLHCLSTLDEAKNMDLIKLVHN